MLKIGIGPSSSHTLGPWRIGLSFIEELKSENILDKVSEIRIDLYGSLSLTGKGHATDLAVVLGLSGFDPVTIPVETIDATIKQIKQEKKLKLNSTHNVVFNWSDIHFNRDFLPFHANGMKITAIYDDTTYESTFYSIGGGFTAKEDENSTDQFQEEENFPFETHNADIILKQCDENQISISELVLKNELSSMSEEKFNHDLKHIWQVMIESIFTGCHSEGFLPGGLNVRRRAHDMYVKLRDENLHYEDIEEWIQSIRKTKMYYRQIMKWVSTYALAVNEVNASLGRVVTAPTNGSAGVIPAVLLFYLTVENHKAGFEEIKKFLLTAGVVGSIFKRNATISAAMGGCQAEIGVSSAMAAAALCELRGGTPAECLNAAEIAMEHHLGLTCDPIGGLVQIPCIERNAMGAIKAINASELALDHEMTHNKVTLDNVIETMWETAKDMNTKYKETSEGGLAISVQMADC